MKIDYEYVKEILDVFLECDLPTVNWKNFEALRGEDEHKFVFHIEILADKNIIEGALKEKSIGISRSSNDYIISITPWRLTSSGHDFALLLAKPAILTEIKDKFKTEGISVVIDIAKKIATKQAEKLLGQ